MRLHTKLSWREVYDALKLAKDEGKVATHVQFAKLDEHGSRKRERAFEVQLGTDERFERRARNFADTSGGEERYAAYYDEWGWFIANIFNADPTAVFGTYDGFSDFHTKTTYNYTAKTDWAEVEDPFPYVIEQRKLRGRAELRAAQPNPYWKSTYAPRTGSVND